MGRCHCHFHRTSQTSRRFKKKKNGGKRTLVERPETAAETSSTGATSADVDSFALNHGTAVGTERIHHQHEVGYHYIVDMPKLLNVNLMRTRRDIAESWHLKTNASDRVRSLPESLTLFLTI